MTPSDARLIQMWFDRLTKQEIRSSETPHPIKLPTGRRLRGIALGHGVFLTRDRVFYHVPPSGGVCRELLTIDDVLSIVPAAFLLQSFKKAVQDRRALRRSRADRLLPRH